MNKKQLIQQIDNNQNSIWRNVGYCDTSTFLNSRDNRKFILADNTSINDKNVTILSVQSRCETETLSNFTNETIKLPDLFDNTKTPTSTGTQIFGSTGITININNLSNAATVQTNEGKTFSYNSTLVTNTGIKINIHPTVMNSNSAGKWVDLNILAWYLLLKCLGHTISILSQDQGLLNSSKTLTYLNKFIIYEKLEAKNKKN